MRASISLPVVKRVFVLGTGMMLTFGCASTPSGPVPREVDGSLPDSAPAGNLSPGPKTGSGLSATSSSTGSKAASSPVTSRAVSSPSRASSSSTPPPEQEPPDASSVAAAAPESTDLAPQMGSGSSFDNLEIVDDSLNPKLSIMRVGSEPTPNNLLSVFAGLKNRTAQKLSLEVQTIYKDKAGNALNKGSWVPMTLKPHQELEYRSAAISESAADYLIRVRNAANSSL